MLRPVIIQFVCIPTFVACAMVGDAAWAQVHSPSLWERRDDRMSDLFSDYKARRPGDILFVTINEQSDVENKDRRLLSKQNSSSAELTANYGVGGGLGTAAGSLTADEDSASTRQFNGDTQFKSEREFIDRFSVTVIDTLPNGNLLISGSRSVALEGDNRRLVLSGVVRSTDVGIDNSVSSRMVSNLLIRYESDEGAEDKFINQGWLGKKLNRIWPF